MINRQIKLTSYAEGIPDNANFTSVEVPLTDPSEGELTIQVHYLSMDPAPRLRISGNAQIAPQLPLNSVMIGRGVGQVVVSRHSEFSVGDFVAGELGWQAYATSKGEGLRKVDPALGPISTCLGVLGPSGLAAYFATLRHAKPQTGETLILNAASGAVGSLSGQIARLHGARVVGIAGGDVQTAYVHNELSFDTVVDYQAAGNLSEAIAAACPQGIDSFMDFVGGPIHDAVMQHLNVHARIVLIGTIANYNLGPHDRDTGPRHLYTWIMKRVTLTGFLVGDYASEWQEALKSLAEWLQQGKLHYRESMFKGLDSAPQAFAALFGSDHVGKMLVEVAKP